MTLTTQQLSKDVPISGTPLYDRAFLFGNIHGQRITMRIFSRSTLREFWLTHTQAEGPLRAWFAEAEIAEWNGPQDIKASYASSSFLSNNRVVFNISGNKSRLIVDVRYPFHCLYVVFVGTHAEYDDIDAETYGR